MEKEAATPALRFETHETWNYARRSTLTLPHGPCRTPMFMPVGTQGAMKGITSAQMVELDVDLMLSNTYWMNFRPGPDVVKELGGLHGLMSWPKNILTDSGGFQMVSLLDLSTVTEEGVTFKSPVNGEMTLLTPEESISIQNRLGADIIMALDDVIPSVTTGPRVLEAQERTIRWLDRCYAAHSRPHDQNLFAIVQGGLDLDLRRKCVDAFLQRDDHIPGYAIGGLSGGEEKDIFWRVVANTCAMLPPGKPRYVMGVGYPVDIVVCVAVGADMFDCVYPCRTARFGTALADVPGGVVQLRSDKFTNDQTVIDKNCKCFICKGGMTRSRLHQVACQEGGGELITYHNIAYMMNLTARLRAAITNGTFPQFVISFMKTIFPRRVDVPDWICNALAYAKISSNLLEEHYPANEQLVIDDSVFMTMVKEAGSGHIKSPYHVKDRNIHGFQKMRNVVKEGEEEGEEVPKEKTGGKKAKMEME
ncbi:putative Queuine tRNA-ribosyltransferase catalytic subunit 1 [Blattamonas nauphoetae]|uniref:Queuine tRNA-ribosyltransferase catalytic subunit 1 n=1 Tax=Blattamonas nauphoetae TaxID=2049346 RepID=A0ABQ9XZ06_9EUKA|nr:putative Queuine tRNA-ribosyltransferase catalytic subunit 1 [Blattamonas nauphoetae]